MLALGSVKTIITENVKNGRIQFDMHGFLAGVILADLNLAGETSTDLVCGNHITQISCVSDSVSHAELITTNNLIIELNDFILGEIKALLSFFTAVSCFCFLLTSGVAVPPWPSSVGGQSLHSSHVS